MKVLLYLLGCLLSTQLAQAKAVFAHFMVGNTESYTQSTWQDEMRLAQDAHIDAFALNIARGEPMNEAQIANAFNAADATGFKLFFSFDYAGRGPWDKNDVIRLLKKYGTFGSHFRHNGKVFVSTFEGPGQAGDWREIKAQVDCFFVPDWSSVGALPATQIGAGIIDGLFNWAAWPVGATDMNTYVDASYLQFLGGMPYMMPVSPWFYTNLPGYDKNWLWRGDSLWFDRWHQATVVEPEWIEIITWNDYGESHYIGPIRDGKALTALGPDTGKAPYDYVTGLDHSGWRTLLPYAIDLYKNGVATVTHEAVTMWHRQSSAFNCQDGGTTGNAASHLQLESWSWDVVQDKVFFAALLGSPATVQVILGGGTPFQVKWDYEPSGGVGIYRGSVPFPQDATGSVTVTIVRGGVGVVAVLGDKGLGHCTDGYANFNAAVKSEVSAKAISATPPMNTKDMGCINGTAIGDGFKKLCEFTCQYDYCPISACMCTKKGPKNKEPVRGPPGYPINGGDISYTGLCAVACSMGFCPSELCQMTQGTTVIPSVSPFTPKVCTVGRGKDTYAQVCEFTCKLGYCPIHLCSCLLTGDLGVLPSATDDEPEMEFPDIWTKGLCQFSCKFGFCPEDVCIAGEGGEYISCDENYSDLDSLGNNIDNVPLLCRGLYTIDVLWGMLESAVDKYRSVADDFDGKFKYYVEYVNGFVDPAIQKWLGLYSGDGNRFFTCKFTWEGDKSPSYEGKCPVPQSVKLPFDYSYDLEMHLDDEEGFLNALESEIGVQRDWIKWGDWDVGQKCPGPKPPPGSDLCEKTFEIRHGYPMKADSITVLNPKDLIEKTLPNVDQLQQRFAMAYMGTGLEAWAPDVSDEDVITALSLPVFMLIQAVDSMDQIKEIGSEVQEEKKKNLILLIISVIFFVVPFIGEIGLAAAGMAQLARAAFLIGEAANAALTIEDIVENPESAPIAILGMLIGIGANGIKGPKAMRDAAEVRRAFSSTDLAKMGDLVAANDGKVQKIAKACAPGL